MQSERSCKWSILYFLFLLLWNIHMRGQKPNWNSIKVFKRIPLNVELLKFNSVAKTVTLLPAFLHKPNGPSTSNPRLFHVDITSKRPRPNFDEFLRHFHVLFRCNFADRKIHVVSMYFFRCNFDGRKIHVVSTYFFWCNFDGRKIHNVSTYFFRCNFDGQKIYVVSTYFFRCNFDGRKIHLATTYFFRCNFSRRNIHDDSTYFFRLNFDGRNIHFVCTYFFDKISMKSTSFLVSCKLMKTFEGVFLC